MKYIILLNKALKEDEDEEEQGAQQSKVKVGHVIIVSDGKKAKVTAVGKDGVTAKDEKGKKYQVLHEQVKIKDNEEDKGKKQPELEVADDEEDKESVEEKREKKKLPKKKKVSPADRAKMAEVGPSGKEQ